MTHNASETGLLLVTRTVLEIGQSLTVSFRIPPGTGRDYKVVARVVCSTQNSADPQGLWPHQVAIEFATPISGLGAELAKLRSPT